MNNNICQYGIYVFRKKAYRWDRYSNYHIFTRNIATLTEWITGITEQKVYSIRILP